MPFYGRYEGSQIAMAVAVATPMTNTPANDCPKRSFHARSGHYFQGTLSSLSSTTVAANLQLDGLPKTLCFVLILENCARALDLVTVQMDLALPAIQPKPRHSITPRLRCFVGKIQDSSLPVTILAASGSPAFTDSLSHCIWGFGTA